jgi:hypothetical protein
MARAMSSLTQARQRAGTWKPQIVEAIASVPLLLNQQSIGDYETSRWTAGEFDGLALTPGCAWSFTRDT